MRLDGFLARFFRGGARRVVPLVTLLLRRFQRFLRCFLEHRVDRVQAFPVQIPNPVHRAQVDERSTHFFHSSRVQPDHRRRRERFFPIDRVDAV